MRIRIHAFTHPGPTRERNEDSIAVGPWLGSGEHGAPTSITFELTATRPLAALVADGLGGHPGGEIASRRAAESMLQSLAGISVDACDSVVEAIAEANADLYDYMAMEPSLTTMGSTVAGVYVTGEDLVVFNVGDSRVYRWQDGFLCQLSRDDVVDGRRDAGLSQCLGGHPGFVPVEPHCLAEKWLPGRRYLICTDGLFEALTLEELERLVGGESEGAATRLLDAALAADPTDNVSALVLERE